MGASLLIEVKCFTVQFRRTFFYNEYFGKTFEDKKESISIYGHAKDEILDFLRTPHELCKHCDIKYRDSHFMRWGVSKKEKEEWIKINP